MDMNMDGGKKRKQTKTKTKPGGSDNSKRNGGVKDKQDGAGVESLLTPLVLYGLRQAMVGYSSKKTRRGGASNPVFVSQPAPLEGGVEDVLSTQLPNLAAQAAGQQEGGKKKRSAKRGGGLGLSFSSQPAPLEPESEILFPGQKPLLPADGGDLTKPVEASALVPEDATGGVLEGGKRKGRKARKGGDKEDDDEQEGGKRKGRKARKGGDKEDDDEQEGGKRKGKKRGGDKDDDEQEGGKRKGKKRGGDKEDDDEQDGGKKRKLKRGGALDLFTQQIKEVTNQLNRLMK